MAKIVWNLFTIRQGKPNVTQKGNKNAMKRDLQLYATILYGRQMGFKNITASFYFLKKDTDTLTWNLNEQSFFGSGNIVSLERDTWETLLKLILT